MQSAKQTYSHTGKVCLVDDVSIKVDNLLRVWADEVVLDTNENILEAFAGSHRPLSIESQYFYMLADSLVLNLSLKTGQAQNVRVHIDGRFISAESAQRIDAYTWRLKNITFTACDAFCPHWSFKAQEAVLEKYFLKIFSPSINVGSCPVLSVPMLIVPPYSHSRSGPCIPKFSVDKTFGLGITLPYYIEIIADALDATVCCHWRQKRGVALLNELRHKVDDDSFSHIHMLYARDRSKKKECPSRQAEHRYWLEGTFVAPFSLEGMKTHNLLHFDFGTDKQIDYDFFNKPAQIEDFFWNAGIVRWYDRSGQVCLSADRYKTVRSRFTCIDSSYHCCREKVLLKHAPQVSYRSAYKKLLPIAAMRHDIHADRIFLSQERNGCRLFDHDTFRFNYVGQITDTLSVGSSRLSWCVSPVMQLHSKLCGDYADRPAHTINGTIPLEGGYRIWAKGRVEYALPELVGYTQDGDFRHYVQPFIACSYSPKIIDHQWLHADEHDYIYSELSLRGNLRNSWYAGPLMAELHVSGGYDWRSPQDIFPLRRAGMNQHLLPLSVKASCSYSDICHLRIDQEYNSYNFSLLQLEMAMMIKLPYVDVHAGWVHQGGGVQKTRCLLSDISSFVHIDTAISLNTSLVVTYSGYFNLQGSQGSNFFSQVDVLLQQLRVDYNGHCWGLSFGFEEKRFSEQGNVKTEHVYCFSFRLQSLGAFAKYFKNKPVILKAPYHQ